MLREGAEFVRGRAVVKIHFALYGEWNIEERAFGRLFYRSNEYNDARAWRTFLTKVRRLIYVKQPSDKELS